MFHLSIELLDYLGVFVFGLSGAIVAIRKSMDVVGVLALAITTSLVGGITRDMMIGDTPVSALEHPFILLVPCAAATVVMAAPKLVAHVSHPVLFFDAVGLGIFSAVGASKATEVGLGLASVVLVGTITAVGGGAVRDVFSGEIPQIFIPGSRFYAIPAAIGALLIGLSDIFAVLAPTLAMLAGIITTAVLRLLSIRFDWHVGLPDRYGCLDPVQTGNSTTKKPPSPTI